MAEWSDVKSPKVAIVHDWLVGGGAERVVEELHALYPDAPIYTSYATKEWRDNLNGKVVTGYLGWSLFGRLRKFLVVPRALWFSRLDLREFDLIISSTGNGEASYIKRLKPGAKHICYCHSPNHFYWRKYHEYLKSPGFGFFNPLARLGLRLLVRPMRAWDYRAMQRPDVIAANSSKIQEEVKKSYDRDSVVIHPPVNLSRFKPAKKRANYYVTAGRQVPYKRHDLAVLACSKLGLPLKVLGSGPENRRLKELAGPTVEFIDNPSDEQLNEAFNKGLAFIHSAEEDFGVMPVESLAGGCSLIAYGVGGALDYVQDGKNGRLFKKQTVNSLMAELKKPIANKTSTQSAREFSIQKFKSRMKNVVKKAREG